MIIDGYRDVEVFPWIRRGKSRKRSRGEGEGCSIGKLVELDVRSLVVLGGSRSSFIEFDKVG